MENRRNLIVTLADSNYLHHAKQLFSSVYWNAGWKGDYLLLAHEIPEKELEWFTGRGIFVKRCKPLHETNIGKEKYPPVVLNKFNLFTPEFRKWKNIVFLDADIIVRASLEKLTNVKGFASVNVMGDKLEFFFNRDNDPPVYQSLKRNYNMTSPAFNSGVMAFSTDIIKDDTFDQLMALFNKYLTITSGDDPVFNILFYKNWKKLPAVYDISPKAVEKYTGINADKTKGIVIHLKEGELENYQLPFKHEWETNLQKAEHIDLSSTQKPVIWNAFKTAYYCILINIKHRFNSSFHYLINTPDRLIGRFGTFLKIHKPGLYYKLRKYKERYPSIFIIEITNTCIAKCHQCEMWKQRRPENEITLQEKIRLIDEIQNLSKHKNPYIHFSGGEPFIKKEEVLTLAKYCDAKNIHCGVDTTGYLIDEILAKEISATGMTVNISLDSSTPAIHDDMRGLNDCHHRALKALDYLITNGGTERIVLVNVLTKKNLGETEKIIRFADEKKVKILFQPLMLNPVRDPGFLKEEYWPDDPGKTKEMIAEISEMKKHGYKIQISNKKLLNIRNYFLTGTPQTRCTYFKKNLCVDSYGDVRLCFFSEPIGNIRENSLSEIYNSIKARKIRNKLKHCYGRSCNLPICQDDTLRKDRLFIQVFRRAFNATDRLIGKLGIMLKKTNPEMYGKLKR